MHLNKLGWNSRFETLFMPYRERGLRPARIARADRGAYLTLPDPGAAAVLAGVLDPEGDPGPPAVGDWVALDLAGGLPVIRAILPRSGCLVRRRPGSGPAEAQAVAANVDRVLVVESLDRGPNSRRIERAVALAWDAGATPVVVLTKADLAVDLDQNIATARAAAPFVAVVPVASPSGSGLGALMAELPAGATAVLLGPSGAGKSTLANALLGEARLVTSAVRAGDARGRHTTTRRELVVLPSGALLIDTPGVRELGLWLAEDAVAAGFPEIEALAGECRFRDCRHLDEPGCAILAAVANGDLDPVRLSSYHRLRREAAVLAARVDPALRMEAKARERRFGRIIKAELKRKGNR